MRIRMHRFVILYMRSYSFWSWEERIYWMMVMPPEEKKRETHLLFFYII